MNTSDRPPTMQFSLRTLLLVILAISLLCAIVTPLIRHWSLERQLRLLAVFPAAILPGLITYHLKVRNRWKSEQLAGKVLLDITQEVGKPTWIFSIAMLPILLLILLGMSTLAISDHPDSQGVAYLHFMFHGYVVALSIGFPNVYLPTLRRFKQDNREFCENGILSGNRFTPWNEICDFEWSKSASRLVLVVQLKNDKKMRMRIPPEIIPHADEILELYAKKPTTLQGTR